VGWIAAFFRRRGDASGGCDEAGGGQPRHSLKGSARAPVADLPSGGADSVGIPSPAQLTATRAATTIKEAVAQYRECASDVRKKPEYAALESHLANPETRQFTMEQLTEKASQTAQQAHLLAF
jgi:hypothetical protein